MAKDDKKDAPQPRTYGTVPKGKGTAYNRVMQKQAKSQRQLRNLSIGLTLPAVGVSAVTVAGVAQSGVAAPIMAGNEVVAGLMAAPVLTGALAVAAHRMAKRMTAHGHAVDGLIAKGRGGSAILGTHGLIPDGGRASRIEGKTERGGPTMEGGPSDHGNAPGTGRVREHPRINAKGKVSMVKEHALHAVG